MAENTLQVGDLAPDFELMADTGEKVKLSDFRGKKVILTSIRKITRRAVY